MRRRSPSACSAASGDRADLWSRFGTQGDRVDGRWRAREPVLPCGMKAPDSTSESIDSTPAPTNPRGALRPGRTTTGQPVPLEGASSELPATVGALRASPWAALAGRSVKDELRANLKRRLIDGVPVFEGIVGYDDTVVPQVIDALLSRHHFILLGLRGQAKTRILRQIVYLLDPVVPYLAGSELHDDPLAPVTGEGRAILAEQGDDAEVAWWPREQRYVEKLATPDVTVADLIGDVDPIKAARLGTRLGDERSVHYGLLPRAHRAIFAVNELPDLAGKVQVALFNVMQEGDVQIKGYPVRLPLDVLLAFSANPEDYTARGKIITPLKDRIGSEIRTHYQTSVEDAMRVTAAEAWSDRGDGQEVPPFVAEVVEQVAFVARSDARVDAHSGVSQRLPISLLESVVSRAERRAWTHRAPRGVARVSDVHAALPAITGKLELEYEGELAGPESVARDLVREAIARTFAPFEGHEGVEEIVAWFDEENVLRVPDAEPANARIEVMSQVPRLIEVAHVVAGDGDEEVVASAGEFVLEGLTARKRIGRSVESGYVAARPDARDAVGARRRWN